MTERKSALGKLEGLTQQDVLELLCDCDLGYPYASEDCPHKAQARRVYARLEARRANAK